MADDAPSPFDVSQGPSPWPNAYCPETYRKNYGAEWKDPTQAACRVDLQLSFDGVTLAIHRKRGGVIRFNAVSGRPGAGADGRPVFDYSKDRQEKANVGPIPEGDYWIDPAELWANNPLKWVKNAPWAWGSHRITIHPYRRTDTYCRGGFFIHGGWVAGSAGCIDLTARMPIFVAQLKAEVGESRSCRISLTVAYPED